MLIKSINKVKLKAVQRKCFFYTIERIVAIIFRFDYKKLAKTLYFIKILTQKGCLKIQKTLTARCAKTLRRVQKF